MTKNLSVDPQEIEKFSKIADQWWDLQGKFKPLHKFNPTRIKYIKEKVQQHFGQDDLSGLEVLDIGCGGGLLSEPMCRLGANMTSIDASEKNIKTAQVHAENSGLQINYQCATAEELAGQDKKFDLILNMEVIEHVADVKSFMQACCSLLKPNGLMVVATLNRTLKSYALAIIGAEYILRWLPIGTHSWKKFLKPSEIKTIVTENGLSLKEMQGVSFNPLTDKWKRSNDINVNYMMLFTKKGGQND